MLDCRFDPGSLFETVKNRDVFHGAYRDVFTAFSKRLPGSELAVEHE
jgi:hypothetical protein